MSDSRTRRHLLRLFTVSMTGFAGCSSSGQDPSGTDTSTDTPADEDTPTPTDEPTATPEQNMSFDEIYDQQVEEDIEVLVERSQEFHDTDQPILRRERANELKDKDYEHIGHMLEQAHIEMGKHYGILNDSQQHARMMRRMVHEDLGISKDQVRIFGRDTAGG